MPFPHIQAAPPLSSRRHVPSSLPVTLGRTAVRSAVSMVATLVMVVGLGAAQRARAEPVVAAPPPNASAADLYAGSVREAAQRFAVPALWVSAVMAIESGGEARARSSQGAMGLMQIMPDTWQELRLRHGLGRDPYDPRDNILAGAAYLREMHDRYGSPGFLAAYNAGPARYEDYLATGRELPAETRRYVATLAPLMGEGQADGMSSLSRRLLSWKDSPLLVARDLDSSAVLPSFSRTASDSALVARSAARFSALRPRADELFVARGTARRPP